MSDEELNLRIHHSLDTYFRDPQHYVPRRPFLKTVNGWITIGLSMFTASSIVVGVVIQANNIYKHQSLDMHEGAAVTFKDINTHLSAHDRRIERLEMGMEPLNDHIENAELHMTDAQKQVLMQTAIAPLKEELNRLTRQLDLLGAEQSVMSREIKRLADSIESR